MTAFRISFDIDAAHILPEANDGSDEGVELLKQYVLAHLIQPARAAARNELHAIRKGTDEHDAKTIQMAERMRRLMVTLMAEANLSIEQLPADHVVNTELPFEKEDA